MISFPIMRTIRNTEQKIGRAVSNYALKFSPTRRSPSDTPPADFTQKLNDRRAANDSALFNKPMKSYKKGGLVHQTGPAMLHKGELVVPKHRVEKWLMSDTGVSK